MAAINESSNDKRVKMMNCENIKQMIASQLPDATVTVDSDDNVHFSAVVVSDAFIDLRLLKRQQMVYGCLGDHIHNGDIHALQLKTLTQDEWQQQHG